ncbi:MAG: DNA alkylation repair protein [Bacillota bacterium]|uniref:DNA alkylation repair protein n=1 Tax=Virgibacillus salarius TaxID=447199 RepID=A0A941DW26_9BACI|nr:MULTISPECIES: hypothetical protein [Bacillaceae]NAZ07983.1 DNA alkylation repair protein [Agaribacter marinus]MBR7795268.1 DNA alkylation repair protein [Virgibacillus salarius]MCC2252074.1 DNA alkylation repair protein [Virgibacillus sp. AGTR]MDY7045383.1 DNA alkylation repair protein [Virgibacillus sp. M23]QRZ19983.1 DNA alkylation repair protein [Virgibacillus sp. AGTR]
MNKPYRCPNCKTNKTRFNKIEQVAQPIKIDATTGETINNYQDGNVEVFHTIYQGPKYRVQCASCGLIEDEKTFIQFAQLD